MRWLLLASIAVSLVACNNSVTVELQAGDQSFDITASSIPLPAELRDGATIRSVDCSSAGFCPSTTEVAVACDPVSMLCDPAPHTVGLPVGDVVDFDVLLSDARTVLRFVDEIQIVAAPYHVTGNTLTIAIPEVQIYWGPDTAADITSPGVTLLGTIPAVDAGAIVDGEMAVDAAGAAAMSNYIVNIDRRIRFFAETQIDLAPGGAFPDGSATVTANLHVRAIGRIID